MGLRQDKFTPPILGGRGNWTTDGCELGGHEDSVVTCHCNHLTNFGVLVVRAHICIIYSYLMNPLIRHIWKDQLVVLMCVAHAITFGLLCTELLIAITV